MKSIVLICSIIVALAVSSSALDVPQFQGYVNDYANMISATAKEQIEETLKALEQSDSTQIFVLTVPSLEGEVLEEYAIKVFDVWKAGQKKLDNGVILIVAQKERKIRIEVGRGLEGRLTDLQAGRIIDETMKPRFKDGDYNGGFVSGISSLIQITKGEFRAEEPQAQSGNVISRLETYLIQRGDKGPLFAVSVVIMAIILGILGNMDRVAGLFTRITGMVSGSEKGLSRAERRGIAFPRKKSGWLFVVCAGALVLPAIAFLTISSFKLLSLFFYMAIGAMTGAVTKVYFASVGSGGGSGGVSGSSGGGSSGGGGGSSGGGASGDY